MWTFCDNTYSSRLILGTSHYANAEAMSTSLEAGGAELVTVAMPATGSPMTAGLSNLIELGIDLLPCTTGCRSVKEAIAAANRSRDTFETHWVKLEIIGDTDTGTPDAAATLAATIDLLKHGFEVMPRITEDIVAARRLVEAGCRVLIPWGAYPGSGWGLMNLYALKTLRDHFPETTLILGSGLGQPSAAALAMELGFDGVMVNHAVSQARDPIAMAEAFADAVVAGRMAHDAGMMPIRDVAGRHARALGLPFWHSVP